MVITPAPSSSHQDSTICEHSDKEEVGSLYNDRKPELV